MATGELVTRALTRADLDAVAGVLNGWFASYVDHLDYRRGVLDFLDATLGYVDGPSVVAEIGGELVGVVLVGLRDAVLDGARLRVVNLGVLATSPLHRRQGIAKAVEAAMAARAVAMGADLVSLLTQEIYRGHRFYDAAGYRVIERFQPPGAAIGEVGRVPGVMEVAPDVFWRMRRDVPRPGAITEVDVPAPPADHPDVPVRCFIGGPAGVAVATWPVRVRIEGRFRDVVGAQILRAWGDGDALQATAAAALAWCKARGAEGILAMPTVRAIPGGFSTEGGSWTLRYARGLTPAGQAAVAAATRYDEVCPAP